MPKNWKLKPEVAKEYSAKFSQFSKLFAQLLYNRELVDEEQVQTFLNPKYDDLPSPFLFQDMDKAATRIWQAIENNEKICIYGDYDADAVTANAVLRHTFRYLGAEASSYIPDRFSEGYGVNIDALAKIAAQGAKIIITVDCGTNSVEAADFCRAKNIDLIITDHHEIIGPKPASFALINPKNTDDGYPYREVTGVGVAFKLACGILSKKEKVSSRLNQPLSLSDALGDSPHVLGRVKMIDGYEKWLLDLVAIGTVADCHSLLGENRILVKYGLKVLAKTKWPGLRALIATAGLDFKQKSPDAYTLGFVIAPRLNAAGRLEHANIALDLLMKENVSSAQQTSIAIEEIEDRLEGINKRRQGLTESILSEAREQALLYKDRKILVLMKEGWHKGVVGLVAGRISEEFQKPAIVLAQEGDEATGSARTTGEFNIIEALKYSAAYLIKFGGHQQAAGLTLKASEYENFYGKILEYAEQNLAEADLQRELLLEAELEGGDLSFETLKQLETFEPFGVHNPRPKFLISNLKIVSLRLVGNSQQHMQLQLSVGNHQIQAIMFNASVFAKTLKIGDTIDVAAEIIKDGWNGREEIKLRVVDIRRSV